MSGSASWPGFAPGGVYDADEIVKLSNDNAIVVLIQYRLGLHGFLAGKEVKKDGALNAFRQWISSLRYSGFKSISASLVEILEE